MSEFVLEIIEKNEFKPSCDFYRNSLTLHSDRPIKILGSITSKGRNIINIKSSADSKFDTWDDALMWSDKIEANSLIVAFDYDSTLYFCNVAAPSPFVYPVRTSATRFEGMSICCLFNQGTGMLNLLGVKGDANSLIHSTEDDYQKACEFSIKLHAFSDMIYSIYPNSCEYDIRNYASFYKNLNGYAILFGNDTVPSDTVLDKVFEKIAVAEHNPVLSGYADNTVDETLVRRRKQLFSDSDDDDYFDYDFEEDVSEDYDDVYMEEFDVEEEPAISLDDVDFGETAKFIPRDKHLLYRTFSHMSMVDYLDNLIKAADAKLSASAQQEVEDADEEGIDIFSEPEEDDDDGIDIFSEPEEEDDDDTDFVFDLYDDDDEEDVEDTPVASVEQAYNVPDNANKRHELDMLAILAIASNGMQSSNVFLQADVAGLNELCQKSLSQLNTLIADLLNSDDEAYKHVSNAVKYEYHSLFSLCGYLNSGIIIDGDIAIVSSIVNGTASLEAVMYLIEKQKGTSFVEKYRKYLSVDHLLKPTIKVKPKFKYNFGYNISHELLNNFVLFNAMFRDLDDVSEHTYVSDIYNLVAAPNHTDEIKSGFKSAVYSNAYLFYRLQGKDTQISSDNNISPCSALNSTKGISGVYNVAYEYLQKAKNFNSDTLTHYPSKAGATSTKVKAYIELWDTMCEVNDVSYKVYGRHSFNSPYSHYAIMLSYFTLSHPFLFWVKRDNDVIDFEYNGITYDDKKLSDIITALCVAVNETIKGMLLNNGACVHKNLMHLSRNTSYDTLAAILTKGFGTKDENGDFSIMESLKNFYDYYVSLLNLFKTIYNSSTNPEEAVKKFVAVTGNAVRQCQLRMLYNIYQGAVKRFKAATGDIVRPGQLLIIYNTHEFENDEACSLYIDSDVYRPDYYNAYKANYANAERKVNTNIAKMLYNTTDLLNDRFNLMHSALDLYNKTTSPFNNEEIAKITEIANKSMLFTVDKSYLDGTLASPLLYDGYRRSLVRLPYSWPGMSQFSFESLLTLDAPITASVDFILLLLRRRLLVLSLFGNFASVKSNSYAKGLDANYSGTLIKSLEYLYSYVEIDFEDALYTVVYPEIKEDTELLIEIKAKNLIPNINEAVALIKNYVSWGFGRDSKNEDKKLFEYTTLTESDLQNDITEFELLITKLTSLLSPSNSSQEPKNFVASYKESKEKAAILAMSKGNDVIDFLSSEKLDCVLASAIDNIASLMNIKYGIDLYNLVGMNIENFSLSEKAMLTFIEKNGEDAYFKLATELMSELKARGNN